MLALQKQTACFEYTPLQIKNSLNGLWQSEKATDDGD